MSRYTGYNQSGFANSTVTVTRAGTGGVAPVDYANTIFTTLYLPFNDDVNDDSPHSQTITNRGSMTVDSTYTKFGSNALKSQTSGSLKIDNSASTDLDGPFTVEFFFYITTAQTQKTLYVHNENNSTYSGLLFWITSAGNFNGYGATGSSWNIFSTKTFTSSVTTGAWHHVAITYDGTTYRGYYDGDRKWEATSSTTLPTGGDHYIFSRNDGGQYQPATGEVYMDDFRITKNKALYTDSTYTVPTSALGIERDDSVSLYLPFDSDVNDDSSHGHTVTASGSAAISSTQTKFGSNSLFIDASGDYLSIPSNSSFRFEEGDFTIEMFIRPDDVSTTDQVSNVACIIDHDATASTSGAWFALHQQNQALVLGANNGTLITTSNCLSATTWHHVVVVRSGSTTTIYCDGVNVGSASDTHDYDDSTSRNLYIGKQNITFGGGNAGGTRRFDGYIDDLRISKGVARYTKNFVPPSQAVGATLNGTNETNTTTDFTSLYLPLDSDVNDDSSDPFTITASGNAAISSAQSKFGGYSLALDGSGDYLTVGSSQSAMAFAGDFTIEFWMYPTSLSGSYVGPMGCHNSSGWLFQFASSGGRFYINGSNELTTTATTSANQWYHVAVTRNSGTVKLFIDGVEQGSLSFSSAMPTNNDLIIGASNASGQYFPGYLDDIRILNGYAKYTADFVAPTSAVGTSVSETVNDLTRLYLPFDGTLGSTSVPSSEVSLYLPYDSDLNDDSSNGHTASVGGSAAISSTQSKFGSYSLYLDGSDDRISYGDHPSFEFGSGDFTMEAFIYPTNLSHHGLAKVILGKFSGQGSNMGFVFAVSSTNYLQFFYSTTGGDVVGYFTSSTTQITTNQWYHVAVTRKGNTGYLFVDGNLETTFSFTSSIANVGTHLLVGAATSYGGGTPGGLFAGYIDDIRIIKGTALYVSSFTAPTSALGTSATAQTFLGGFEDEARNHGVTKNGDATLNTSVKKFGTSSLYLDGTGDYLKVSSGSEFQDFNSKPFTIEGFFYCTDDSTDSHNIIMSTGTGTNNWNIAIKPDDKNFQLYDGTTRNTTGVWTVNTWHHFAVCFDGFTLRQFIDGTQIRSESYSNLTSSNADMDIGRHGGTDSSYFEGYLDDLRIIKGHAKYTANFTAPTSAHGHVSIETDESTSESYSDTKFLSGIWDITDVRDKMMQSTWISNDSRLPNGAGLEVTGHRWNQAPAGPSGTPFTITAYGAGGGDSDAYSKEGGAGGYAQLTVDITGPDTLFVVVGQAGNRPAPSRSPGGRSYAGGGGSRGTSGSHPHQAPGGGFSGVFMSSYSPNGDSAPSMPSDDVMIVAGGGGGAGSGHGGAGGGETGQAGQNPYAPNNGGGGTQNSGGAAGAYSQGTATTAGVFLTGGRGNVGEAGGGGGGGYYGGGGGGYTPGQPGATGAGGGGSGYVGGASGFTVSSTTNTQGGGSAAETHGQVTIRNNDTGVTTTFDYTGGQQTYSVT